MNTEPIDHFPVMLDCPKCLGSGFVCENHPDRAWGPGIEEKPLFWRVRDFGRGPCHCGGAGQQCQCGIEYVKALSELKLDGERKP